MSQIGFIGPYSTRFYAKVVRQHHRLTALGLTALIIATVLIPVAAEYQKNKEYNLNAQASSLLGKANPNLTKKLTHDTQNELFQFNKEAIKTGETTGNPLAKLQSKIGGAGAKDDQQYSVDAPEDLSRGATYYDNQSQLNFKITPQFGTMKGREVNGHLVYPMSGAGADGQLTFTLDAGGLKENVILYKSPGNTYKMSYKLDLPNTLEAKLLPTGEVGIYSADPTLFGNITYGSSDDQAKVQRARVEGVKNYLSFKIPAPVVTGLNGGSQSTVSSVKSSFALENNVLTVTTVDLDKATYPLAIDPTVAVDSTSDFQSGNLEDNNSDISGGNLSRGALTGGSVGSYASAANNLGLARGSFGTAVYNGKIYVSGGNSGSGNQSTVLYASLASDGSVGAWSMATNLPTTRLQHASFAYNGYLYVMGGNATGSGYQNDVLYAKIQADGSLGSWQSTTNFATPRRQFQATVYNGFAYVMGGCTADSLGCSGFSSNVQYAPVKADGTLGTWTSTSSFTTGRQLFSAAVYGNAMYIVGGANSSSLADVQYAPINSDGTLGTWTSTTSLPAIRQGMAASVMNGYLYVMGGNANGTVVSDTLYAQINANGSLGSWQSTASFATPRAIFGSVAYNGYVYAIGGCTNTNCPGYTNDVSVAKVSSAGSVTPYTSANTGATFTARYGQGTLAYNGYMYVVGGYSSTYLADISYAPINPNGTLGAWASAGASLPSGRINPTLTASNGYMYVTGGFNGSPISSVLSTPIATNGTTGSWATATNSFSNGRRGHASTIYNGYLYVSGGYDNGINYYDDTQFALLCTGSNSGVGGCNATPGSVGTWASSGATLPSKRAGLGLAAYGGYMYATGGVNSGGVNNNEALYAQINANGTLGAWTSAGTGFTSPRAFHGTAIYNGNLYISAGNTGSFASDTQYAPLNANGTIGTWVTAATILGPAAGRYQHGAVVYAGNIYAIGGLTSGSSTGTSDAVYARINNGGPGTTSAWAAGGNSFYVARNSHASVAYNGYLYIVGGSGNSSTGSNPLADDDMQRAPINANGTIGTFLTVSTLPTGRVGASLFVYNNRLYVVGGDAYGQGGGVVYANINPDNSIGSWATGTSYDNGGRSSESAAIYNGTIYVSGGYFGNVFIGNTYYNDVQFAKINADGTVGTWQTTTALPYPSIYGHKMLAYNGYMYVIGGGTETDALPTIIYAKINSDSTLGSWKNAGALPFKSLYGTSPVALNGYLYLVGGSIDGSTSFTETQITSINADGTLGDWTKSTSYATGRSNAAAVTYNGYLYVSGGANSSSYSDDVQFAAINSISRKTKYSKLIDLGASSNITAINYTGSLPYGASSISYKTADPVTNIFSASKNSSTFSCLATDASRYVLVSAVLDDSLNARFGESSLNIASLDSITVTNSPYAAPPSKRLRHGAFFQNEVKQDFSLGNIQCSL